MNNTRGKQKQTRFTCEITCNGTCVMEQRIFTTLKEIAEECGMSYYQICDLYEGRIGKKYNAKYMPQIKIKALSN
tara:strand:+ start:724 stop:948 length:225 start_codon:yes stop_codon:yes gene_type:complete